MEQYKRDSTIPVYINKEEPLQDATQPRKDTYPAAGRAIGNTVLYYLCYRVVF